MKEKRGIILAGAIVGIISVLLVKFGNPINMGFCIACFIRDIAGGIGLHRAPIVQYIRPEIIGLVLGAFIISMKNKEFQAKGGSSPFTRFVLGIGSNDRSFNIFRLSIENGIKNSWRRLKCHY